MSEKNNGPNWKRIKAEYVRGGISQEKLAAKHGVPYGTLRRRCLLEKWSVLRKQAALKAGEKLVEKTADIQADTAAKLLRMQSEAALAVYEKMLGNIRKYPDGVGTRTRRETFELKTVRLKDGTEKEIPLRSSFVNDLEATVRSMARLAKLFGIDEATDLAKRRIDIERQRVELRVDANEEYDERPIIIDARPETEDADAEQSERL